MKPERDIIFSDIFILRGPNHEKNYMCNSQVITNCDLRPNGALDKKVEENRSPFLKWGSVFIFLSQPPFGLKS